MNRKAIELPEDPDELQLYVQSLHAELYAKTLHIEKLKAQLAALRRARYGRSSEKLDRQIEQLELMIADLGGDEQQETAPSPPPPSLDRKSAAQDGSARRLLPAHLPRETVVHTPPQTCNACGGGDLRLIGTDRREVLEYVPAHFKAIVHERPRLSCRQCEAIMQEHMPSLPIERGLPGPGLLAHVLVSKYCDHLPLHRQGAIYAREGVEIERSTMAGWVGQMGCLLHPLSELIARHVREGRTIHADDTPVPVLDPGRGRTKTGRLWVAVRDERPFASRVPPAVFYDYAPDRKAVRAANLLIDAGGYLHVDAYAGFKNLFEPVNMGGTEQFTEVACWAHARRKIYEVHAQTGSQAAANILAQINALFAVEARCRGKPPDERSRLRQSEAVPILETLKNDMERTLGQISGKTPFAQALRYALTRWQALSRYTTDGRLEISNNAAERAIRPLALGRKNWLFAGSDGGGKRAAVIYTLIESAKMNRLDPEGYLRAVIDRIADHPINRLDELLPWNIELPTIQ